MADSHAGGGGGGEELLRSQLRALEAKLDRRDLELAAARAENLGLRASQGMLETELRNAEHEVQLRRMRLKAAAALTAGAKAKDGLARDLADPGRGLVWRLKTLTGGLLHVLDLGTDALMILSFLAFGQWGYFVAACSLLAVACLTSIMYTMTEHTPVVRPEEKKAPSLADMLAAGSKKLKTVEKPDEGRRTSAAPNELMLQMQKILDMRKFLQDPESSDEEDAEFD